MTSNDRDITKADLMAYADNALDAADRARVAAHIAQNPEDAARVTEWQRQNEAINALYGHVADEKVPARLKPSRLPAKSLSGGQPIWQLAAAAMLVMALGVGAGWYGRGQVQIAESPNRFVTAAIDAHALFVRQPVHPVEVGGDDADHLTNWLSATIDRRLVMPDLQPDGFTLLGGRILPGSETPAVQIMYQGDSGERVTLYLTPRQPSDPGAARFVEAGGVKALYWAGDTITGTIVGELSRAELEELANTTLEALSWPKSKDRPV